MRVSLPSGTSFFLIDSAVILTLFGFFTSNHFDIGTVYEVFPTFHRPLSIIFPQHLNPSAYSFFSSPFEFILLSIFRLLIYISSIQLSTTSKVMKHLSPLSWISFIFPLDLFHSMDLSANHQFLCCIRLILIPQVSHLFRTIRVYAKNWSVDLRKENIKISHRNRNSSGVWLLPAWNLLASAYFYRLWQVLVSKIRHAQSQSEPKIG